MLNEGGIPLHQTTKRKTFGSLFDHQLVFRILNDIDSGDKGHYMS